MWVRDWISWCWIRFKEVCHEGLVMFGYLRLIMRRLDRIEAQLRRVRFMVSRPKELGYVVIEELDMKKYRFGLILPPPPADQSDWGEIASGTLTVAIPGSETLVLATTKDQQLTESRVFEDPLLVGAQDAVVEAAFNYIDDAGNPGAKESIVFELQDTIPPVNPTGLASIMLEEIDVPEPPVEG